MRKSKEIKELEVSRDYHKDMHEHYKELFDISVGELKFEKLMVDVLASLLYEIESFTKDKLVISVIKNGLERYQLDKLIHARILFYK